MNICHPLVGDDSLTSERKENNEYDSNVVETVFDDFTFKKVAEQVPFYLSELASKLLQFLNNIITFTGKKVNREADFKLEIPADYVF